jgi:hypothetical protein
MFRAALDWSFSPTGDAAIGVALTAAFAPVWLHLLLVVECRERAERALNILSPGFNLVAPLERRLHISLGIALTHTMGPVEKTRTVLAKARQLAESVDDVEAELRMLWAQWSMENILGEYRAAQSTAQRFSEVAQRTGDYAFILLAEHFVLWSRNASIGVPAAIRVWRCYSMEDRVRRGIASSAWLNTTFRRRAGGTKSCFNTTSACSPERDWHVCFACKVILIRPKSRPA